jgi:hypothetical protein
VTGPARFDTERLGFHDRCQLAREAFRVDRERAAGNPDPSSVPGWALDVLRSARVAAEWSVADVVGDLADMLLALRCYAAGGEL